MDKATTFAPALREKHEYNLLFIHLLFTIWMVWKNKKYLFLKRFGSSEKSTTFAPALRVKLSRNKRFDNLGFMIWKAGWPWE